MSIVFPFTMPVNAEVITTTIPVASYPIRIAVNPTTNKIYVANDGSSLVSVIDGTTNTVTTTIPVASYPTGGITVNPTTNKIYVASKSSSLVSVIDGTTNRVTTTIPVASSPVGITVNPTTNKIYVANDGSSLVSVIDGTTNTVTTTIPVASYPDGLAVNPTTNKIYVASKSSSLVSVIDGTTNTVTTTIPVASYPVRIAVNPTTNKIYVANESSSLVSVIDGTTNTVTTTIPVASYPVGIAVIPPTNKIYVVNYGSSLVSIIDGTTNTVTTTIPVASYPIDVAVNPTTNKIYVANYGSSLVSVITGPDIIPPTITTPPNQVIQATSSSGAIVTYPAATATDNVGVTSGPTCTPASGSTFSLGTTTVTCTSSDAAGNIGTASFTVGVIDTTAPTVITSGNIVEVTTDVSGATVNYPQATATDNVGVTSGPTCIPSSGSTFLLGQTTVTCTATDAAGNIGTASFIVTVQDPRTATFYFNHPHVSYTTICSSQGCYQLPQFYNHVHTIAIIPPPNITVEATSTVGAQVQYDPSKVIISTEQIISNICTPATGQTFPLGITTVTCSATDAFGFTGTAPFTVNVIDTTAPAVIIPDNIVEEAIGVSGAPVNYPQITATDNVGVTSGPTCTPSSSSTFSIGTTTVTCTATDSSGNTSTKSFDVIVQDTSNPEVSSVSLTPSIVGGSSQITITKIASDLVGINTVTAQIKGPSPSTDIIGTVTLSLNSGTIQSGTWSGAFTFPSKDIVPDGTYTIDEIVTDVSGNSLLMNDGIITLDRTAPTLSVISITPSFLRPTDLATITASTSDALSGVSSVTTQDSTLGSLQISLALISGSTDPGQVGTFQGFITGTLPEGSHEIMVSTKDNAITPNENSITVNNAFTIDATDPFLTLPSDMTLEATSYSGVIVQYTVSASDDIDVSVPVICDVSSDTLLPFGNTLITCSASDDAGNTSTDSFNVTVVDTTVPKLTIPSDITAEAISATGSSVQYSATAIDIVDGNLIPTCTPSSDSIFPLGLTMVTCSATDAAGNTGTSSFSVTIQDTTAPLLTIPSNLTLEAPSLTTPANTGTATATDTVDSTPLVTYSDSAASGTGQILSVITRTWTATDSLGNSASADQIITIQDTTAPIITAPNDITIISTTSVSPLLGTPTVSDNFDSSPIVTNDAPASFAPGTTTTITWTATDHTGNSQSSTQQVIINTPGQATNDITTLANSFGANTNVLGNTSALLNDNNPNNDNGACGKLDAFINKINSDNNLSSAEKTQLILAANAIKTSLGC